MLNEVQAQAVSSQAGTILIGGAPGTGKTHVLAHRFEHLLSGGSEAPSVLTLTFSSRSAEEFQRRVGAKISPTHEELWVHTFHSFARKIISSADWIQSEPEAFLSPFKEYLIVKEILEREKARLSGRYRDVARKEGFARELADFFKLLKQNILSAERFTELSENLTDELTDLAFLYRTFEDFLQKNRYVDLSDIVTKASDLLRTRPELLARYRGKFRHILVDEFEEISLVQFRLLSILLDEQISLCIAGNEKERIFGFRGSGPGWFDFIRHLRNPVEEYLLKTNYRLPESLQSAASNLMSGKDASDSEARETDSLKIVRHDDPIEQAYAIAREIKQAILDGNLDGGLSPNYSDFAVICRSMARSALPLEEAFAYYEIPCGVNSAVRFSVHPLVGFILAVIGYLDSPDDDAALERALGIPAFGIDPIELKRVLNADSSARQYAHERLEAFLSGKGQHASAADFAGKLRQGLSYLNGLRESIAEGKEAAGVIQQMISQLFFKDILEQGFERGMQDSHNLALFNQALTDIQEICSASREECSLEKIIEHLKHSIAFLAEPREDADSGGESESVKILTVHQAKGLEFPYVYLVDATDEFFPTGGKNFVLLDEKSTRKFSAALRRYVDASSFSFPLRFFTSAMEHLLEERQLMYVAITRASRRLSIHFTNESHFSEPVGVSPFVEELADKVCPVPDTVEAEGRKDDIEEEVSAAFNTEEIEGVLHRHLCNLAESQSVWVREKLKVSGLDEDFICSQRPFGAEAEAAPVLKQRVFSASQLSLYLSCPKKFFYERILRISAEPVTEMDFGQLVHAVLEEFHAKFVDLDSEPAALEAEILGIFQKKWDGQEKSEEQGFREHFGSLLERATINERAQEMLKRYVRTEFGRTTGAKVIACEKRFEFQVRGLSFVAKVDRIDELSDSRHRIIDYKTSQSGPVGARTIKKLFLNLDQKEDYAPQDFQFPLYLLAGRSGGYDPAELVYYWVAQENAGGEFKKSVLRIGEDEKSLSLEEILAAEDDIVNVANQILAGDFPAAPRSAMECQWCSFDRICEK